MSYILRNFTNFILWIIHFVTYIVELLTGPYWMWRLGTKRIKYYKYIRAENDPQLFTTLIPLFESAVDIKIAVGELGHRLIENPHFLFGLKYAYTNNYSNIEIIHGPRVDPKTTTIFDMANDGLVSIYKTPLYHPHHFILVTNTEGHTVVIEEGRHLETKWIKNRSGKWQEGARSLARVYYVYNESSHRAEALMRVFRTRKTRAQRSHHHPGLNQSPQKGYGLRSSPQLIETIAKFFLLKFFYQPWAILMGNSKDIDLHERWANQPKVRGWFKKSTPIFQTDVPSRVTTMLEGRVSPNTVHNLREAVSISGPDATLTVADFRVFHMLEFGVKSVAYLDISDETFLDLITRSVDTIEESEVELPMRS